MSDMHTASVTGRDFEFDGDFDTDLGTETETELGEEIEQESGLKAAPFTPDDAWVDQFEKQLTPALIDRLRNYARPKAFSVAAAGRKVDDYYVRELVQDVIGNTWTGVTRWDPGQCSLEQHLLLAIKALAYNDKRRAKRNPHDALGDETDASRAAEEDASSLVADPQHSSRRVFAQQTMAQIRSAAAEDKPVLWMLDAYEAGAQCKDDVLVFTRMKARTYHNAHIRLKRIVRNMTDATLAPKLRA